LGNEANFQNHRIALAGGSQSIAVAQAQFSVASDLAGTAAQAARSSVVECAPLASRYSTRQRQMPARFEARHDGRVETFC
jgi:hypothetical protein